MGWNELPEMLENRISDVSPFKEYKRVDNITKYRNKKTEVDGIIFDSRKESEEYVSLKIRLQCKDIQGFERQVRFEVFPGFEYRGKKIRPIYYVADFVVTNKDGTTDIVDVKSPITRTIPTYKMKIKMLWHKIRDKDNINFVEA